MTNILLTGIAGYIGSHCAANFIENNYNVIGFDNFSTGFEETIKDLKKIQNFCFIKGDLSNYCDIESVFQSNKIDVVVHFAAFSQVSESVNNPIKYYENNLIGSINLLKSMIKNNVKNIVFSSTAAIYGEPDYIPIDENHPQKPINPYGKSKLFIEEIMDDLYKSDNLNSIRLRYFNVIGADKKGRLFEKHNPETHLVPNIFNSVYSNDSKLFELYGNDYNTPDGTCVRDYVDVEDLAIAHRLAVEKILKENVCDFYNLGTNTGFTVKEIFDKCSNCVGKNIQYKLRPRRCGDPEKLVANNNKASRELFWFPKKSLEESLYSVLNYYYTHKNSKQQNLSQTDNICKS